MTTARCEVCGVVIKHVAEPHWSGWVDVYGDNLSYVPTLHDHVPEQ